MFSPSGAISTLIGLLGFFGVIYVELMTSEQRWGAAHRQYAKSPHNGPLLWSVEGRDEIIAYTR